jgi:hypothetical protein
MSADRKNVKYLWLTPFLTPFQQHHRGRKSIRLHNYMSRRIMKTIIDQPQGTINKTDFVYDRWNMIRQDKELRKVLVES